MLKEHKSVYVDFIYVFFIFLYLKVQFQPPSWILYLILFQIYQAPVVSVSANQSSHTLKSGIEVDEP